MTESMETRTLLERTGGVVALEASLPGSGAPPALKEDRGVMAEAAPLGRDKGLWARLAGSASGEHTLALLDQAVVSGTSFLTTILIGRWCGAEELGIYALGFSLLVSWACAQEALIALPYTIGRHRLRHGSEAEYAGSALVHQGMLSAIALVTMAVAAAALSWAGAVPGLVSVVWVLAGVIPLALLREFGRRFAFAHLRMAEALVLDLVVAAAQLAGLAGLAWSGVLTATTAYAAFGLACVLTGAVWVYATRKNFVIRWNRVWHTLWQSWALGKWLFASQVTLSVQGYFVHWLLAWTLGAAATGVYAACMTVVLFSNPLILGIANALAPRAAQAFAEGGGAHLRRVVFQTTLLLGAAMMLFCGALFFGGEDVMTRLYHGSQYEGHGHTVFVLALAMLASAVGMPASNGLAAVERPNVIFRIGVFAVGLSVFLGPWLVAEWGVMGAAYCFLIGNVVGAIGRWVAFGAVIMRNDSRALRMPVIRVLQQFTHNSQDESWVIEPLSEGAQARTFAVRTRDHQPIMQTYDDLAVKLYKSASGKHADEVQEQFEAMSHFHAVLAAGTVNGWKIQAPVPLYRCESPIALVMTRVPGKSLSDCLSTVGQIASENLDSLAEALVAGMERCWSVDTGLHGDFNFDNILCDIGSRSLSFVDPGVREEAFLRDRVLSPWYPASRDLAHLLFETEVSVKKTMGNPGARVRQRRLAEKVLRAFLTKRVPQDHRRDLLAEIDGYAQIYLNNLQPSWTPKGVWRWLVRQIATRRINDTLTRLRTEAELSG
jgi:O-antigen/teichoic acid export membrane protein